jgi:hypothetical protein
MISAADDVSNRGTHEAVWRLGATGDVREVVPEVANVGDSDDLRGPVLRL